MRDPSSYVSYGIRPNLRTLGPRLGKRLNGVREALSQLDPTTVAKHVESGQAVDVETSDGQERLEPADILVDFERLPGYAAAQGPRLTVVLDTSLTPQLIQEGYARDFVRGVQDARKRAGYRIEDTIKIAYVADPEVSQAIEAHRNQVMTETLATVLISHPVTGASDAVAPESVDGPGGLLSKNGQYVDQVEVGEHNVRIALTPNSH